MKKVKVMLMALLVVAGVGGALAFKAAKGQNLFCGTTPPPTNSCPILTTIYKLNINQTPVSGVWCSSVQNGNCTTVVVE